MKTIILFATCLMISAFSFSQITIEETDLMMAGDTFLIHVDLNPTISVDLSLGTGLTWDFTGLQNDMSNFACYASPNDLEFIDDFPQSEFYTYGPGYIYAGPGGGAPLDNWGYMMFYTNPDGLFAEGFYSDYGMGYRSTMNTPPEMLMFTPASYLGEQTYYSSWEVVVDENNMDYDTIYRRNINKSFIADAWGSLTSDYGSFDVIRIHETGINVDSIFGYVGTTTVFSTEVSRDTINNYYFWAKDVRNPIVTVHCDYEDNIERIDYLMGVIYSDNSLNSFDNEHKIYPNPAEDYIILENFKETVEIYNLFGQSITKINNPHQLQKIDISMLKSGMYFLKTKSGKTNSFVVY